MNYGQTAEIDMRNKQLYDHKDDELKRDLSDLTSYEGSLNSKYSKAVRISGLSDYSQSVVTVDTLN